LEYDKGERRFEDTIVEGTSIDDLDFNLIKKYANVLGYEDYNYERLLLARGLARRVNGQFKLTNAAIILFAFNPTLFLPNTRIRFIRYDGIKAEVGTEMNIIKNVVIEGSITEQIKKAQDILKGQLREFTMLNLNNGKFITIPEYPELAWLEGIVNAVTHRAYNIQGDDIKIFMFDDRLEIISPGKFPNIVNKENIKDTRYSRNPRIARALTELGWVRELGEGVKRIYKEMQEFFLDEPIFNEPGFSVSLVLKNNILTRRERRLEKVNSVVDIKWDELSDYDKKVIEYLYSKGRITSKELSELIGKSTTYSRKILKQLENKNIIKRISTSKNDPQQYFVLIEKDN
jgi:ATP-dependent DNA helicase RecG